MDVLEKLHFRSDGFSETPSGLFAVEMLAKGFPIEQEVEGEGPDRAFRFRLTCLSDASEVQWDSEAPFALFPQPVVRALVEREFARPLTLEAVEAHNEEVSILVAAAGKASAAAEKEATEKALAEQAATEKAAAEKAAAEKAAAEKVAAEKEAADKAAAEKVAAEKAKLAAEKAEAEKAAVEKAAAEKAAAEKATKA